MVDATSVYTILHLRHPHPIPRPKVIEELSRILDLSIVPHEGWLSKVTTAQPDPCTAKFIGPALTLLDQLQPRYLDNDALHVHVMENNGLSILMDIEASLPHSATLSNPLLPQLNGDDIRKWVACWGSIDALPVGRTTIV